MQKSWRDDSDKLTFIVCVPLHKSGQHEPETTSKSGFNADAGKCDVSERMLGDVNLFLTLADEDDEACVGEIELMIASAAQRRRGYGRATVLAFMHYIQLNLPEILYEYASGGGKNEVIGKMNLLQLRVKIGGKNESSIKLFESVGFIKVGEGENYFGEVELCLEGFLGEMRTKALLEKWNVEEYEELTYNRI
jgi:RimJ/RimL family protein N-acetyltransferase